jgi:hypothetical protein
MTRRSRIARLGLILGTGLLAAGPAVADTLTFNLDTVFNPPVAGTAPYVVAKFESATPGIVTLTLSAPGLTPGEFVGSFYFNVPGDLGDAANLNAASFSVEGDALKGGSAVDYVHQKADGDGYYDVRVDFDNGAIRNGSPQTVTLKGADAFAAMNASWFNYQGESGGGAYTGPFYVAAHIQNVPPNDCSGWLSSDGPQGGEVPGVPLPATSAACLTLLGIVAARRGRRQRETIEA